MRKLKVDLKNCYGIKNLKTEFDFEQDTKIFALYAPNGSMKTSFANTFRDISKKEVSKDRVWPENETTRIVVDEDGNELDPDSIFVIEPYSEEYKSGRISTLLVNHDLRSQYVDTHKKIDDQTSILIGKLKDISGLKSNIKEVIAESIAHDSKEFFKALKRVHSEVETAVETPLGEVKYTDIFNPKVESMLSQPEFIKGIEEYISKYDQLLSNSTFFKKGVFTHNNAEDIAKTLGTSGFFKAGHSVYMQVKGERVEIDSHEKLKDAIEEEKNSILTDEDLRRRFDKINASLKKNVETRRFLACLEKNPVVISELLNINLLRERLWTEYLTRSKESYLDLVFTYNEGEKKINEIIEQAKNEGTKWANVISIYNHRFDVPFEVCIDNQEDVILKRDAPNISFVFLDDADRQFSESKIIEEDRLRSVLSNGERRALYILNIIFEIEARKEVNQKTLFIVDDIADSFDYKNKYAIIEYLKEIGDQSYFNQIILSHNFDFYRTVSKRFNLPRENRLVASKENGEISIQQEYYQNSPFNDWRKNLCNDEKLIASIPFVRNLAGFSGHNQLHKELTSLLHIKPDTDSITISGLQSKIQKILDVPDFSSSYDLEESVKNLIYRVADHISGSNSGIASLEEKVALSIAIRLKAEEFMIRKINDANFWHTIEKNQTIKLIQRFKNDFSEEKCNIRLLNKVNLMTPENIHINSFMYEPILDMSAQHLKQLFGEVKNM